MNVVMPEDVYLREHARLIKLLEKSKKNQLMKEAEKQKREIKDYLRNKKK